MRRRQALLRAAGGLWPRVALGVRVGLSRTQLLDLGCSALAYDVGMVRVPESYRSNAFVAELKGLDVTKTNVPVIGASG